MIAANPMSTTPLTLSLWLLGSHLVSEETTASTVAYEMHADPALSASEFEVASQPEGTSEKFQVKESIAWLAFVEEVTTDSRAMTDEERRAVDDFFLSQFENDDRGSRES